MTVKRTPRSQPDSDFKGVMEDEPGAAEIGSCEVDLVWRNDVKTKLPMERNLLDDLNKAAKLAQNEFYKALFIWKDLKRIRLVLDENVDLPDNFDYLIRETEALSNELLKPYMNKIRHYTNEDFNYYNKIKNKIISILAPMRMDCNASKINKLRKSSGFINIENILNKYIDKVTIIFCYTIEKLDRCTFPFWAKSDLDRRMYQLFIEGKDSHTNYGEFAKRAQDTIRKRIGRKKDKFIKQMINSNFEPQTIKTMIDNLGLATIKVDGENCYIDNSETEELRRSVLERILARRQRQPPKSPPPTDPTP